MLDTIKKNRVKVSLELYEAGKSGFLSPAVCLGDREIAQAIENHASGKLLDIGCGEMPYRNLILPKVEVYDTLDIEKRHPGVKYLGDVQNMTEIRSGTYDTATCFAVLEHVPDPLISFKELARVLKPQGKLILTVPHLSRLHEEPHDYFRFTKYGIKAALEAEGFEILELKPVGGLFCFLGHQVSIAFLGLLWHVPLIKNIALWINKLAIVESAIFLDKVVDKKKLFAMDYLCVAQKE